MSPRQITAESPSSTPLHVDRSSSTYRFLPKWCPLATPSFRASFKSYTVYRPFSLVASVIASGIRPKIFKHHPPHQFSSCTHPSSLSPSLLSCVNPSSILSYNHPAPSGLQLPHSIVFATTKLSRAATTLSLFQAASTLDDRLSCIQTLTPSSLILATFASSLILSCIRPARSSKLHPHSCSFELHSHSVARSSCGHPYAHSSGIHPPRSSEMHPLTCSFELHSLSARFELHPPFMLVSSGIHPYAHLSLHSHSVTLLSRIHSLHSPELHPHFVARFRLHPKPLCSFQAAPTTTLPSSTHPHHSFEMHPLSSLFQVASTLVTHSSRIHPCPSFELHPPSSLV